MADKPNNEDRALYRRALVEMMAEGARGGAMINMYLPTTTPLPARGLLTGIAFAGGAGIEAIGTVYRGATGKPLIDDLGRLKHYTPSERVVGDVAAAAGFGAVIALGLTKDINRAGRAGGRIGKSVLAGALAAEFVRGVDRSMQDGNLGARAKELLDEMQVEGQKMLSDAITDTKKGVTYVRKTAVNKAREAGLPVPASIAAEVAREQIGRAFGISGQAYDRLKQTKVANLIERKNEARLLGDVDLKRKISDKLHDLMQTGRRPGEPSLVAQGEIAIRERTAVIAREGSALLGKGLKEAETLRVQSAIMAQAAKSKLSDLLGLGAPKAEPKPAAAKPPAKAPKGELRLPELSMPPVPTISVPPASSEPPMALPPAPAPTPAPRQSMPDVPQSTPASAMPSDPGIAKAREDARRAMEEIDRMTQENEQWKQDLQKKLDGGTHKIELPTPTPTPAPTSTPVPRAAPRSPDTQPEPRMQPGPAQQPSPRYQPPPVHAPHMRQFKQGNMSQPKGWVKGFWRTRTLANGTVVREFVRAHQTSVG